LFYLFDCTDDEIGNDITGGKWANCH